MPQLPLSSCGQTDSLGDTDQAVMGNRETAASIFPSVYDWGVVEDGALVLDESQIKS